MIPRKIEAYVYTDYEGIPRIFLLYIRDDGARDRLLTEEESRAFLIAKGIEVNK